MMNTNKPFADNPNTLKRQPAGSWKPVSAIGAARQTIGVDKLGSKADIIMAKVAKVLSTQAREHISKKNFAIPSKKNKSNPAGHGAYPIPDKVHARAALSMVSQHGSSTQKAEVRAKVHAKFPNIGQEKKAGLPPGTYVGQEAWEARHPEINNPVEIEANRKARFRARHRILGAIKDHLSKKASKLPPGAWTKLRTVGNKAKAIEQITASGAKVIEHEGSVYYQHAKNLFEHMNPTDVFSNKKRLAGGGWSKHAKLIQKIATDWDAKATKFNATNAKHPILAKLRGGDTTGAKLKQRSAESTEMAAHMLI